MKKVIWSIVLSWVCLAFAAAGIGTRDAVSACDGKVYKKGDKIMFGVPKVSGYLFVRTFTKDGKISTMPKENLASQVVRGTRGACEMIPPGVLESLAADIE